MSTQHLSAADRHAIAIYFKSLPADDEDDNGDVEVDDVAMRNGKALYVDDCQACHMDGGTGLKNVFPPFAGSSAIVVDKPQTLIEAVLEGATTPATQAKPSGLKMPAFEDKLSDAEVADVLTYIRNAWGNHASAVSADAIGDLRQTLDTAP